MNRFKNKNVALVGVILTLLMFLPINTNAYGDTSKIRPGSILHLDQDGNKIYGDSIVSGEYGSEVWIRAKMIPGYVVAEHYMKKVLIDKNYKNNVFTFVYARELASPVNYTIRYIDETGKEILDSSSKTGEVGLVTDEMAPEISGYSFIGNLSDGKISLSEDSSRNIITFVYKKDNDSQKYILRGIDEKGMEIYRREVSGNFQIGESLSVYPKHQNLYALTDFESKDLTISNNQTSNIVTFKYHEIARGNINGTYLINYVDVGTGQSIVEPEAGNGLSNSSVKVVAKDIPGYRLLGSKEISVVIRAGALVEISFLYTR